LKAEETKMAIVTTQDLEGCMCEYIPEDLREQITAITDTFVEKFGDEVATSQVMVIALQLGLAVIMGKMPSAYWFKGKQGEMKNRKKSKLSGKGF
jgi:hypothetical protein